MSRERSLRLRNRTPEPVPVPDLEDDEDSKPITGKTAKAIRKFIRHLENRVDKLEMKISAS